MFRLHRPWLILIVASLLSGCSLASPEAKDYLLVLQRSRALAVIDSQLDVLETIDEEPAPGEDRSLTRALARSRYRLEKITSGRRETSQAISSLKGEPPAAAATLHRRTMRLLRDVDRQLRLAQSEEAFGERLIAVMAAAENYQSDLANEDGTRSLDDFLKSMTARAVAYEDFAARFRSLKPPAADWNSVIAASAEPFSKIAANLRTLIPAITTGDHRKLTELNRNLQNFDAEMRRTDLATGEFIQTEKEKRLDAVKKMRRRKNQIEEAVVRLKVRLGLWHSEAAPWS